MKKLPINEVNIKMVGQFVTKLTWVGIFLLLNCDSKVISQIKPEVEVGEGIEKGRGSLKYMKSKGKP